MAYRTSLSRYRRCLTVVPRRYAGAGRSVYPGFLQVGGFMSMNVRRHLSSHAEIYRSIVRGEGEASRRTRDFYAEYFAVLDIAGEFYLETVERIFQKDLLAKGEMTHHGRPVRPEADHADRAADDRGRARRHVRPRPDRGRARAVHRHRPAHAPAPPPARCRSLRRVRRQPLVERGVSGPALVRAASTRAARRDARRRRTCPATRTRRSASSRPARRWASPLPPCCSRAWPRPWPSRAAWPARPAASAATPRASSPGARAGPRPRATAASADPAWAANPVFRRLCQEYLSACESLEQPGRRPRPGAAQLAGRRARPVRHEHRGQRAAPPPTSCPPTRRR